ncbi:hypothetical protein BBJ28_00016941 [Nothophytophthora sp. Chile5]|nr:hypothetical protein BBJ28_00016941 [Nothophytophthora sp. Chile5]
MIEWRAGASARSSAVKTTVRVSHQPGGGGANVYAALYGGPDQASASTNGRAGEGGDDAPLESSATQEWLSPAAGDPDLEVSGDVVMVDQSGPTNDEPNGETLSEIDKDGDDDILMDDAAQNGEKRDTNSVELDRGRVATDTVGEESVTEPAPSARVCLPAAHPFFSQTITKEDAAVLLGAMTTTPVRAIADEFERVALNWFRDSLQLVGHLRWLRKLMLMSEGLCMDIFARDFLRGLSSSARVNWGVDDRLTSALTLAMIEGSVTSHAIVQSFHYKTTDSLSQGTRTPSRL